MNKELIIKVRLSLKNLIYFISKRKINNRLEKWKDDHEKKNKLHKNYNFKDAQLQKLVCKLQLFHDCISSFVPKNQTVKREELFLILYLFSLTQNNGNTI